MKSNHPTNRNLEDILANAQHLYFLGIGGIGMSALATFFHSGGKKVSGYDRTSSIVSQNLEKAGIEIFHTLDASHIAGVDMMIYTPAIKADNLEYQAALALGIPILKRSELLGLVSKAYRCIAVAGTHGKTTTSSIMAHVLRSCDVDCTAFLGGIARNFDSNFVQGTSDWVVAEADEFDRSFLTLSPEVAVITSLDADHLDIYGSPEEMHRNYMEFAAQVQGKLLVHAPLADNDWPSEPILYGIESGTYQALNLRFEGLSTTFDFVGGKRVIKDIRLPFPGKHNVLNAVAAMGVACEIGADEEKLKAAASSFKGIYRRFELQENGANITYIDDYAHHPTELLAAIDTGRRLFPERQLVVVFQPHLYSRTRDFAEGFSQALSDADAVIMLDIYPARELPIPGITSELILKGVIAKQKALASKEGLIDALTTFTKTPTVLLTLGAGDIDRLVPEIQSGRIIEWANKLNNQ